MSTHIIAFIFYTLAMLGVIFIAFSVYKKVALGADFSRVSKLKVEDMLRLNARKSLYVITYENEKFLIASDLERTTFLSKLEQKNAPVQIKEDESDETNTQNKLYELKNRTKSTNNTVMRNILKELNSNKESF